MYIRQKIQILWRNILAININTAATYLGELSPPPPPTGVSIATTTQHHR
jgi:hypothetical protein